jgi:rubredoxin
LTDLVNEVCDRNDDHEEHITTEGDNFEQRVEEESVVPEVKSNMREVWICPICSVHVKHRQNIARHQSVNCSAVKVPKLKPEPVSKPESRCEICGVIFLCKTSLNSTHEEAAHGILLSG